MLPRRAEFLAQLQKRKRFGDTQVHDLCNVFTLVSHIQGLWIESTTLAGFTSRVGSRQKVHFHFDGSHAFTGWASTTFAVEGKTTWKISPHSSIGSLSKQLSNVIKETNVGSWRRARHAQWVSDPPQEPIQILPCPRDAWHCIHLVSLLLPTLLPEV